MFGIDQGVALELDGGAPSGPSGLRAGVDVGSESRFHMSSKKHDEVRPVAVRGLTFRTPRRSFSYIDGPFLEHT